MAKGGFQMRGCTRTPVQGELLCRECVLRVVTELSQSEGSEPHTGCGTGLARTCIIVGNMKNRRSVCGCVGFAESCHRSTTPHVFSEDDAGGVLRRRTMV